MGRKVSLFSIIVALLLAACAPTQELAVSPDADITVFSSPT